jgi:peptidoglycan hydrolase-like protein with peptidoglycan-binding domain
METAMNKLLLAGIAAASLAALLPANAQQAGQAQQQQPQQQSSGSSRAEQSKAAAPASNTHDEIMQAQEALNQKGFDVGKADGIAGPQTRRALRRFQREQGLQQSGRFDNRTLAALGVSPGQQGSSAQPSTTGQGGHAPSAMGKGTNDQNRPAGQAQQKGGSQNSQSH